MRMKLGLLLTIFFICSSLSGFAGSQDLFDDDADSLDYHSDGVCGTGFIIEHDEEIMQNTQLLYPNLSESIAKPAQTQFVVGDTISFYTVNFKSSTRDKISVICRYKTNRTYIFVGLYEWNTEKVTQTSIDNFYQAFEVHTPAGSLDPNKGIREILETTFGAPPNKSGDGYVYILIYDIKDDYDNTAGKNTYIAGYFSPTDQTDSPSSNQKDIIFVDCNPANPTDNNVLATVAHEYQHLIHNGIDAGEYANNGAWVNEGISEYSEVLCGFSLRDPSRFLHHPERSLVAFGEYLGDELVDYAKVALWTYYLGEKFGLPLIKEIVHDTRNGVDGVRGALTKQGITLSFEDIFANFVVANYIDNPNLTTDGRYGYYNYNLPILPEVAVTHKVYPVAKQQKSLPMYAASYFRYTASDSTAILSFGGQSYGSIRAQICQIGNEEKVESISLTATNLGDYNLQAIGKTASEILFIPTSLGANFVYYYSVSTEIEDENPPQITVGPNESLPTGNSITIFWETDELSTSIVEYGTTTEYGPPVEKSDYVVSHQVVLSNLTPNTLYHYRVGATDANGNGPTYSADFTFATVIMSPHSVATVQQSHSFGYEARSLTRSSTGNLHLLFHEIVGDRRFIYHTQSTDNGVTWSTPMPIDTTLYYGGMPAVAMDGLNRLHVAWHAKALASSNYGIYYSRSEDSGTTWSVPQVISKTLQGQDQLYAAVAIDNQNNPHVVWNSVRYSDANMGDVYHSYSADGGNTWPNDQIISSSTEHRCFVATIDFTSTGRAYVFYSDGVFAQTNGTHNVFNVHSDDYQQWSTQEQISTSGVIYDGMVSFTIDRLDRIHVVYSDNYTPGDIRILYTRNESGLWQAPVPVAQSIAQGNVSYPNITADTQNNLYLVYRDDMGSSSVGKFSQKIPFDEHPPFLAKTQQTEIGEVFLTVCKKDVWQTATNLSSDNTDSDYPELPKQLQPNYVNLIWVNQLTASSYQIKSLNFSTLSLPNSTPPKISAFFPANGATDLPYFKEIFTITATFDQRIVIDSLIPENIRITSHTGGIIPGNLTFEQSQRRMQFVPSQNLLPNDLILVQLTTHITNEAGIGLDGNGNSVAEDSPTDDFVWSFSTQAPDTVAPSFTLGVLQNPVLTRYMDIYLIASEYLSSLPELKIGDHSISVTPINTTTHIYKANYRLSDSGIIQLLANGKDLAENSGSSSKNFAVQLMIAGQGGSIFSPDEHVRLLVPAGAINEDLYVTIVPTAESTGTIYAGIAKTDENDMTYQIGPTSLRLQQPARLQFHLPSQNQTNNTAFVLQQQNPDQSWTVVPTTMAGSWLAADIQSLGNFRLVIGTAPLPLDFALRQNYPNPFSLSKGQTTFFYELPVKTNVEIVIYNLLGEQIRRLVSGTQDAGIYPLRWDGTNNQQRPVASGIYFYQLHAAQKVVTKKMIVLP